MKKARLPWHTKAAELVPAHVLVDNLSRFSAIIVSISSVAISLASLWYAVSAQNYDREYRELLIRPRLDFDLSVNNIEIGIKNRGLGPAIINRYIFDSSVYTVDLIPGQEDFYKYEEGVRVGLGLFQDTAPQQAIEAFYVRTFTEVLDKGERFALTEFDWTKYDETERAVDPEIRDKVKASIANVQEKFRRPISELGVNFRVCHCSLKGKYCDVADLIPRPQKTCEAAEQRNQVR